jgi:hypothetical protein
VAENEAGIINAPGIVKGIVRGNSPVPYYDLFKQ